MSEPYSAEQLDTWPEIAGYLRVSIREAQYRAKSEGLPVHRGVGKKPRVWALRSELDAWRLKAGAGNAAPATNPATDQPPPDVASPRPVEESNTPRVRWGRRAILSAAGLAATVVAAKLIFGTRKPRVERAVLTGSLLTALDGLGRPIWEHRFLGDLQPRTDDLSWRVQVVDLEGSGSPSVLVVCSRVAQGTTEQTGIDELTCFTPDGHVKWTLLCRPDLLDFDGKRFEAAWRCSHVIAVPSGRQKILWVAVNHGWRWPGCVMRVNTSGVASLQFANAGWVERLCLLTRPNGEFVALTGENNAFDRSFAAVIRANDPPSCSPAGGASRCRFGNTPPGTPQDYVLFPTTEMLAAADVPYGSAHSFDQINDGGFVVWVSAGGNNPGYLLYEFSDATEPRSVMPSDNCPAAHRRLEEEGELHHTWAKCPELQKPLTIRHWRRGSGWQDQEVPWRATTDRG